MLLLNSLLNAGLPVTICRGYLLSPVLAVIDKMLVGWYGHYNGSGDSFLA